MKKLAALMALVGLALLVLTVAAPSAPEGVLKDVGDALRALWGYPVSG